VSDYDRAFFAGDKLSVLRALDDAALRALPDVSPEERLGPCIARPGKIVGIGLNYGEHARETGKPIPGEPIVFLKAPNTVVGPHDDILIPRGSTQTDWEVELGVVIGKDARYLGSPAESATHIAGYTISHDVSERCFQYERGGQWTKGKSCDTFNPLGPMLVTPEEIADVQNLTLTLDVNGVARQRGCTSDMLFSVSVLIHYLSHFMTLEAGDLLNTGTPHGVGAGRKPPVFLREGDVVELSVEGLGTQRQVCRSA
jgi:2-keto-4-pentenoate hydratase/2-oxohepta-3-ene-1,7-dioic acid hydratase in catechol pathway